MIVAVRPSTLTGLICRKLRYVGHEFGYASGIGHWCPGCRIMHVWNDAEPDLRGRRWEWHGIEAPTFSCERDIRGGSAADPKIYPLRRCHFSISYGAIMFFPDCLHVLAGRTVGLPDLPSHLILRGEI